MFWIDMHDPAVEVRPIHQASGGSEFNEVYFTDLRVKDSQRLGGVGDGWKVALVTLMNERLAVGGSSGPDYKTIMELARETDGVTGAAMKDGAFREKLADWYVAAEGLKYTRFRTMTALSRGQTPGPESSIGKIIAANQMQEMSNYGVEMEDPYGILADPSEAPLQAAFQQPAGILVSPQPGRHFSQHADGGDIGGLAGQIGLQATFGDGQVVVAQGRGRSDQLWGVVGI